MATITLPNTASKYPATTVVSAYAARRGEFPPDGVPPGSVVSTGTVQSDGSLTISGLADETRYWLHAEVADEDVVVTVQTSGSPEPTDAESSRLVGVTGTPVVAVERTFTETATAAGTYTGTVPLPAGATLIDVIVNGVALWNSAGAVTMIVGDGTDPDGYLTAVDLKATDLLAGESLNFALAGGKAGAYIANNQVSPRYSATARNIIGVVTTAATGGTLGRTRMTVIYSAPIAIDSAAATKA
jgi:hypothetical protein